MLILETLNPVNPPRAKQRYTIKQKNSPYNGRSLEEDSLTNYESLMPASSGRCDEWGSNQGKSESDILHFMARIIDRDEDTEARKVILSCFPCDSTFMIYEPPVPNSGMIRTTYINFSRFFHHYHIFFQDSRVENLWNVVKL